MQPSHMMMGGRLPQSQMSSRPAMPSAFFMNGGMPSAAASMMHNAFAPPMPSVPSMTQIQLGMQMRAGMSQALQHMSQMNQMNQMNRTAASMMAAAMIPQGRPPMGRSGAIPMSRTMGMRKTAPGNASMGNSTAPFVQKKCFTCGKPGHVANFCPSEYRMPSMHACFYIQQGLTHSCCVYLQ
jgi:hypothetical protein